FFLHLQHAPFPTSIKESFHRSYQLSQECFAICFTLTACFNNSPTIPITEHKIQDSVNQDIEAPFQKSFNENRNLPENYVAPRVSIDSIYAQEQLIDLLENWNKAINQQDLAALSSLYAPQVTYYTKKLSKEQLLSKKEKYFVKSPNYQQKIKEVTIEYSKDKANIIRCLFLKLFDRNGKQDSVFSLIEFDSRQEPFLITKESDRISEWQKAKKTPAKMELPKGKHYFSYDYLEDKRNDNVTAWDFINCSHSLSIDNSTEEIELSFSMNYGPGSSYRFFIKSVQISEGIISFEGMDEDIWLNRIEDGDTIPARFLTLYQFKILDFHTLVELDKDYNVATYYHRNNYTRPKEGL
ncbi:MAG: nuclear transport factor 2 family protein, partial [Aureispira sp.]|nr:nuclear transport factor 2 family protein [Aureispira sp.]